MPVSNTARVSIAGAVLLALLFAQSLAAQTQAINGAIRGRVTDQTGAPIPAARVSAESPDTGFSRSVETSR